jgi:hypothetical protein
MSTKRGIWEIGMPLSVVLEWCKRTLGKFRRVPGRIADQSRLVGRETQFEATQVMNLSHPLHADLAEKWLELREFTKVLNIGDRVRVFCDDGVLVAEKISETQFRLIHTEMIAELVH